MSPLRQLLFALSSLILVACGGGDGGGSSSGTSSVNIAVTGPSKVESELYERQTVPSVVINWQATGDLASLSGKTVYVLVAIQHPFLFTSTPAVNVSSSGTSGNIQLFGAVPPDGEQTYNGTITVRACLDVSCNSQLSVSNATIPYTTRVKTGLKAQTPAVILDTTFGTAPAPAAVAVSLPAGVKSWTVKPNTGNTFGVIQATKATDGSNAVVLSATELVLPNTTYGETVRVEAVTADNQTLVTIINASLVTRPSTQPFALQRSSASFTVAKDYPFLSNVVTAGALFPNNDRDRFKLLSTTYTWPGAADGNAIRDKWLYSFLPEESSTPRTPGTQYFAEHRVQGCYDGNCLPVGRYTATLRYQYTPAVGAPVTVDFPIVMDITP